MNTFNVWLHIEEVNEDGDTVTELEPHEAGCGLATEEDAESLRQHLEDTAAVWMARASQPVLLKHIIRLTSCTGGREDMALAMGEIKNLSLRLLSDADEK